MRLWKQPDLYTEILNTLFYAFVMSKLGCACVVWNPYQQLYVHLIEDVLQKFVTLRCFVVGQRNSLYLVGISWLISGKNNNSLKSLQKTANGLIYSEVLLCGITLQVPRITNKSALAFHFEVSKMRHHLNHSLFYCVRLYNRLQGFGHQINIFFDFNKTSVKRRLLSIFYSLT